MLENSTFEAACTNVQLKALSLPPHCESGLNELADKLALFVLTSEHNARFIIVIKEGSAPTPKELSETLAALGESVAKLYGTTEVIEPAMNKMLAALDIASQNARLH